MSPAHDLIERLYGEHHHAVLRFARARDYDLAEDVVSETFAIAMRRADAIPAGAERAWLCGVADNVLRNLRRKEARAASLPGALKPYSSASTPAHDPPVVGPALNDLPDTERAVLALTAFEGLTSGEAADRLGLSPGSTRNAMVRARRNLALQLAGFGVLLLVPVVFFLLRDRASDTAPQAQRLAQTLDQARSLTTDATVRRGTTSERYGVEVDGAAGTQRITLPDGQVAEGPVGGKLRIVPQAGVSAQERRETSRENAPALAALETITSGDLERFLAQARRAGVQQRTTGSGADQVTVVEGTHVLQNGQRVELRVTLAGEPTALRQLKIRPAGQPSAPWTTVDVRRWKVELPAGGSAPASSTAPRGPSASAPAGSPKPPAASTGNWASSDQSENAQDPSAVRRPSTDRPGTGGRRIPRETAARNRRDLAAVPTYTGGAGAVLHTKSRTVSYLTSDSPRETRSNTLVAERWEETGGGKRFRSIDRYYEPDTGAFVEENETWRNPSVFAIVPRRGRGIGHGTAAFAIFCAPADISSDPDPALTALADARTHLGDLPRGRNVAGRPTRRVDVVLPAGPTGGGRPRYYVDAVTGVPLQYVWIDASSGRVQFKTTYELWEEIPAGGSADDLEGTPPREFHLDKPGKCADGSDAERRAPGTAATTPPPTAG